MSILSIIILILIGIILLLVEFLIIPGITVAGISGVALIALSIYLGYHNYGLATGNYILLATIVIMIISFYYALKSKTWKRVALSKTIDGKMNTEVETHGLKAGDTGICISRLNPMGKVLIKGNVFEAKSHSGFIDEKTEITIIKIDFNTLIVKPDKK